MHIRFFNFFCIYNSLFLANCRFVCSFGLLNACQSGVCLEQTLVSEEAP